MLSNSLTAKLSKAALLPSMKRVRAKLGPKVVVATVGAAVVGAAMAGVVAVVAAAAVVVTDAAIAVRADPKILSFRLSKRSQNSGRFLFQSKLHQ